MSEILELALSYKNYGLVGHWATVFFGLYFQPSSWLESFISKK